MTSLHMKSWKYTRLAILLAMLVILLSLAGGASSPALGRTPPVQEALPTLSPDGGPFQVVRAYYSDRQMVNALAAWLEPWEVHHNKGYLVVGVTPQEAEIMLALGFRLEVDQRLTDLANQPLQALPGQTTGIPGFDCYRTVEETFASAQALAAAHPNLASWIDIGDSWDKSDPDVGDGYDMMVLRLTSGKITAPKPALFIMSAIHAREYATAELTTRFAEYLVNNYNLNADVTWLLDYHEIHLLLQSNPDGRKKAEQSQTDLKWWRKNTNRNYCSYFSNDRGADLNRNFEFAWGCCGGSSPSECADTYRGPTAASEPETQAIQNYVRSIFADLRGPDLDDPAPADTPGIFLDIHSYSQLVLWPWGFSYTAPPNGIALQTLGRKFAYFNGYTPQQAVELYYTDGTTDDFAYGDLGLAAYTFEVGLDFFEPCINFEETILPDNLAALIYAAKAARTPYLTPAGPDVVSPAASPSDVEPGTAIQLSATINDTRYFTGGSGSEPSQPIAAAEYYIDIPPWDIASTPVSVTMNATDGAFNSANEAVTATLDTTSLSGGWHMVYIRGQDAAGNWGAVSAVFIYIWPPNKIYLPNLYR